MFTMKKLWGFIAVLLIVTVGNTKADVIPHLTHYFNQFTPQTTSAYPNPFNESTTIFYSPTINEFIKIKLYNNKGQLLSEIFEDVVEKGESYRFEIDGSSLSPGVYFYTIEANGNILHQRIDLVR